MALGTALAYIHHSQQTGSGGRSTARPAVWLFKLNAVFGDEQSVQALAVSWLNFQTRFFNTVFTTPIPVIVIAFVSMTA